MVSRLPKMPAVVSLGDMLHAGTNFLLCQWSMAMVWSLAISALVMAAVGDAGTRLRQTYLPLQARWWQRWLLAPALQSAAATVAIGAGVLTMYVVLPLVPGYTIDFCRNL